MNSNEYDDYSNESSSDEDTETAIYEKKNIQEEVIHEIDEQKIEISNMAEKEKNTPESLIDLNDCKNEFFENFQNFSQLEPISIKTDFTCSVDNQKSPQ